MEFFLLFITGMAVLLVLGIGLVRWWQEEPRLKASELPDLPDDDGLSFPAEVAKRGRDARSGFDGSFAGEFGTGDSGDGDIGSGSDGSGDSGGDGGGGD